MTPDGLLGIFRENVVYLRGTPKSIGGNANDYLKITRDPGKIGEFNVSGVSHAVPVMKVEAAEKGEEGAFLSWICDYEANDIRYQTLTGDRLFCFTATMNGCTFGIGSATSSGTLIVSHANKKAGNDDIIAQSREQARLTKLQIEHGKLFQPTDYEFGPNRKVSMTLFGIFIGGTWEFYYQQYLVNFCTEGVRADHGNVAAPVGNDPFAAASVSSEEGSGGGGGF